GLPNPLRAHDEREHGSLPRLRLGRRFLGHALVPLQVLGLRLVEPLSRSGMQALFWALAGLAAAFAVGFCFRVAAILFVVGFAYVQLIDVTTYLNHYYLAALLGALLAISPAHRAWSIDAWLRKTLRTVEVRRGWLTLMRFQVAVVYTFAGLAKANADWLIH